MSEARPQVKHIYQNHHLDSTRWNQFVPRHDDIVIATPYKCGTTWMQNIVMNLIFQDLQIRKIWEYSKWLDFSPHPDNLDDIMAQEHRRFIKTHLPLDGLRFFEQIKYIVVGRDARDVFMSLWNHYRSHPQEFYDDVNGENLIGEPFPQCPDNIRDHWTQWISKGWFEWETEGYPHWSNMHHVQTWWNFRHLPNILFVHYNDLLSNLEGEIQRIADYLDIEVADDLLPKIADAVTFKTMKQKAEDLLGDMDGGFRGGAKTFINKGTNGRWRGVLTEEDLKLYDAAVNRVLTPDCAHWLENGRLTNS
jgi:aryl sulfotransferase